MLLLCYMTANVLSAVHDGLYLSSNVISSLGEKNKKTKKKK